MDAVRKALKYEMMATDVSCPHKLTAILNAHELSAILSGGNFHLLAVLVRFLTTSHCFMVSALSKWDVGGVEGSLLVLNVTPNEGRNEAMDCRFESLGTFLIRVRSGDVEGNWTRKESHSSQKSLTLLKPLS